MRRIEQNLASFLSGQTRLMLQGANARADVDLPLPARWAPQTFMLKLKYRNSVSLDPDRSQLRLVLNGLVIGQFPLDPSQPEGEARVRLPIDLLQAGFNQLSFAVAQHTVELKCEDPNAPELWTQIDTRASILTLEYRPWLPSNSLATLANFAPRQAWGQARLRISTPLSDGRANPDQLKWGALISQVAAVNVPYQPLDIRLESTTATFKEDVDRYGDLVVVGTKEQLRGYLGEDWAADVTGAYIGINTSAKPVADQPDLAMLVVSGRDEAEVTRASASLAKMNMRLPDVPAVLVEDLQLPDIPADIGPKALVGGVTASFADLGVPTTTMTSPMAPATLFPDANGKNVSVDLPTSLGLDFWVPAGFFPGRTQYGTLTLNYGYGARMREDSVLNLSLNGLFLRAIPLNQPAGSVDVGYEVRFPTELLRAGQNRLELSPMLAPSHAGECEFRHGNNLLLTVYGDSTLRLPPGPRMATLPDLDLLARAGFPWLRAPAGDNLAVQLTDTTPEITSAAWTLLARMAQIKGSPLYHLDIGQQPDSQGRERLVIGPVDALDSELRAAAPISWQDDAVWIDYPVLTAVMPAEPLGGWAERALARVQRWIDPPAGALDQLNVRAGFTGLGTPKPPPGTLLGDQSALLSFESPREAGKAVLLLTARTPELLVEHTARLVQPDFWYNLKGDLVLWETSEQSLLSRPPQRTFTVGQVSTVTWLTHLVTTYPAALITVTLTLLILLASLLFMVIGRFRRRHHPEVTDDN
ncbi:cellulose biosynthesis cyclic di-GMP-binding regulatory protein BcsB [Rhabdochromatium marinum]|uniref:cellulose biosynthesis cyclic di-GMP-binding regulatory protein BcsB n=1 Tax=Rhabdochromatium marinum TaxID=48729 RepID=UPI001902C3AD|nr:cellulose biosynthesis cyclic di-GMP-binding regulatory protein BcsB [Rhabdochromatium marinum]